MCLGSGALLIHCERLAEVGSESSDDLNYSASAFCRTAGEGQQVEQADAPLQLKPSWFFNRADDGDRLALIFLDKNVDLGIAQIFLIFFCDQAGNFSFSEAGNAKFLEEGQPNESLVVNPGLAIEFSPPENSDIQQIARTNAIAIIIGHIVNAHHPGCFFRSRRLGLLMFFRRLCASWRKRN